MADTREKILSCAKKLFNERGINDVSIGDIASEVGISKGNVTYHFAKKELIVEALVLTTNQMPQLEVASSIDSLIALIAHMQQVVQENAFYFRHYAQIAQMVPKIANCQKKAYKFYRAVVLQSFNELSKQNLLRENVTLQDLDRAIDAIFMTCVFWLPFSELKGASSPEQPLLQCAFYLADVLSAEGNAYLESIL